MGDNIPLSFIVGMNIDNLKAKADEGKKIFEELGRHAEKEGAYIDALFQHLGKGFDVSTIDGKMNALRNAISDNNLTLRQWGESVELWSKQADEAFSKGDYDLFNVINKDIVQTKGDMKDLEAETAYLTNLLKQMEESIGQVSQSGTSAPRLFITEEDYQHVKDLEQAIGEMQSKLAQAGTDTEFTTINAQIIDLQKELDAANANAVNAAAALGEGLGGKAAESSMRLYELNATLKEQQETYDDLVQKLEDVAQQMDLATAAGDVSRLKDLQLEYQHLAEQVENANNALQETKGEQKDASSGWEDMLGTISQLADGVEASTRPVGQAITSFSQLASAFRDTKDPVATFRAALQALRGGMGLTQVSVKGVITAIKALGKALLSNPFTAILMAIAAVTAATIALVKSIETQAQKQKRLNEIQRNYLELLQQTNQHDNNKYDDAIKAKERELSVAKSANKSLAEQYRLEDELLRLKQDKASYNAGYFKDEIEDIEKNRDELYSLQEALKSVNDAKAKGDKKITMTVNGKQSKQKVDEAIEWLQRAIENKELLIKLGVDSRDAKAEADAEAQRTANERKERAKQVAATERSVLRETESVRIALINDGYKRDIAQTKANAENKIKDLKLRLSQEANLTAEARKSINDQIKLQQQKLNNDLERLEREHQQKLLAIRRQVEDANEPVGELTAQQRRDALARQYARQDQDLTIRITDPNTSEEEIAELYNLQIAYRKRYSAELAILNLQIQQDEIETAKEGIDLRLAAVKDGSAQEYELRRQAIEAERKAALVANKLLAKDRQQSESDINAKFNKMQKDLLRGQLEQYLTYEQKQSKITREYAQEREKLYKHDENGSRLKDSNGNDILIDGATMANIEELNRQQREAIQNLMLEFSAMLSTSDVDYRLWLNRIDNATVLELEKLLTSTKMALDGAKKKYEDSGTELTDEQKSEIEKLQAMIAELEARIQEADLGPDKNTAEQWKKWGGQVKSLGSEISNLGNIVEGTVGEVLSSIGTIVEAGGEAIEKSAEIAANGVKTVEDASVILALVSSLLTAVKELDKMLEKVGLGDPVEKRYLDYFREQNKKVKELEREYERLGEAISKAYGSDKSKLLTRQIQIAKEQLSKLVDEYEKLRKKQEKYNNREWYEFWVRDLSEDEKDRLEELGYEIEDREAEIDALRQQAIDAIFGSDIQSAIESFAEAYANAWEKGMSSAETAADYVKQVMKDVVMEAVKQAISASGKIDEIRKYVGVAVAQMIGGAEGQSILNSLFPMNRFLSWFGLQDPRLVELLKYTPEQLVQMATDSATGIGDIINGIFERTGILGNEDSANDRSAQARGIATASQDSVDELNGRATTIQGHTFNISENSNIIRDNVSAILGSVRQIESNTDHLNRMDTDIHNMQIVISDIQQQGVKIRNS